MTVEPAGQSNAEPHRLAVQFARHIGSKWKLLTRLTVIRQPEVKAVSGRLHEIGCQGLNSINRIILRYWSQQELLVALEVFTNRHNSMTKRLL